MGERGRRFVTVGRMPVTMMLLRSSSGPDTTTVSNDVRMVRDVTVELTHLRVAPQAPWHAERWAQGAWDVSDFGSGGKCVCEIHTVGTGYSKFTRVPAPHGHSIFNIQYSNGLLRSYTGVHISADRHLLSRLALDGLVLGTMFNRPIAEDSVDLLVSLLKKGRTLSVDSYCLKLAGGEGDFPSQTLSCAGHGLRSFLLSLS